jgi:hypothetical protein
LAVPVDWTFGPLFSKIFDDDVKMTILLCYVVIPFLGWANSFHAASDEFLRLASGWLQGTQVRGRSHKRDPLPDETQAQLETD